LIFPSLRRDAVGRRSPESGRRKRLSGSRHGGLGVLVEEARGRVVVDERVVGEPLDCAAAGTGVAEGVPRGQQVRMLLHAAGL